MDHTATNPDYRVVGEVKGPADLVGGYLTLDHGTFFVDSLQITLRADGSGFTDFEPKSVDVKATTVAPQPACRALYFPNGLDADIVINYQRVYKEDEENRAELKHVLDELAKPITGVPFKDLGNRYHAFPNPDEHNHSGEDLVNFDTLIAATIAMSRRDGVQPEEIIDRMLVDYQKLKENELMTINQYVVGAVNEIFIRYSRIDMTIYQELVDAALDTDDDTIVGAINEIRSRMKAIEDTSEYLDNYEYLESSLGQDIDLAAEQTGTSKAYIIRGDFRVLGDFYGGVTHYDVRSGDLVYYDADTDLLYMVPVGTLSNEKQSPTASGLETGNVNIVGSLNQLYILITLLTGTNHNNPFKGILLDDTNLTPLSHDTDCFYVVGQDNVQIIAPWGGNSDPRSVNAGKIVHYIKATGLYEVIDGNIPMADTAAPDLDVYDPNVSAKVYRFIDAINAIFTKTTAWQTAAGDAVSFGGYLLNDVDLTGETGDKVWLVTKASGSLRVTAPMITGASFKDVYYGDTIYRRATDGKFYINPIGWLSAVALQDPDGPLGNIVGTINQMNERAMRAWGRYPEFEYGGLIGSNTTLNTQPARTVPMYQIVSANAVAITAPWDDGQGTKTLNAGVVIIYDHLTDTYLLSDIRAEDVIRQAAVDIGITDPVKHIPTLLNNVFHTFDTLSLAAYQTVLDSGLSTQNKSVVNAINELVEAVGDTEGVQDKWLQYEGVISGASVDLMPFASGASKVWVASCYGSSINVRGIWNGREGDQRVGHGDAVFYDDEVGEFRYERLGIDMDNYLKPDQPGLATTNKKLVEAINEVFYKFRQYVGFTWDRYYAGALRGNTNLNNYSFSYVAFLTVAKNGISVSGNFESGGSPQTLNIGQTVEFSPSTGKWKVRTEPSTCEPIVSTELTAAFGVTSLVEAINNLKIEMDGTGSQSKNWLQFDGYINGTFSSDAPNRSVMRILSGNRSVTLPWLEGSATRSLTSGELVLRRNSDGKWFQGTAAENAAGKLSPNPSGLETSASSVVGAINEVEGLKDSKNSAIEGLQPKTDNALQHYSKNVRDAINELEAWRDDAVGHRQLKPGDVFGSFREVPSSEAVPLGSAPVSRSTYADLFAVIGTKFGAGNGSTTFGVPDKNFSQSSGLNLIGQHNDQTRMVGSQFGDCIQHPTANKLYYTTYINGTLWVRWTDGVDDYGLVNSGGWADKPDSAKPALLAMSDDGADLYILFAYNGSYTGANSFGIRKYSTVTGNLTGNTGVKVDNSGTTDWWPNSTAKWVKSDKTMFVLLTRSLFGSYIHEGFWIDMTGGIPAQRVTTKWNYTSSPVDMTSSPFLGQEAIYFRKRDNDDDNIVPALEYLNPDGWRTHDFLNAQNNGDPNLMWPQSMVDMGEGMLGMIFYDPGYSDESFIYLFMINMRTLEIEGEYELPLPMPLDDAAIKVQTVLNGCVNRRDGGFWLNILYDNRPWLCHYGFGGATASFPEFIKA